MKKAAIFAFVILTSACSSFADFWHEKEVWTQNLVSHDINFFSTEPMVIRSEMVTERTNKTNHILTAYKGQAVVYARVFAKETLAAESVRINKDGSLNSGAAPNNFRKGDTRRVIGTSYVDGYALYLVPSDLEGYVFLVRDNGTFYRKMGQIRNGRLVIMQTEYVPFPEDLRFEPAMGSITEQNRPTDGFEIRFEGIKVTGMEFTYMTFGGASGKVGNFETLRFPARPGLLNIKGNKINVISVNNDRMDFTILD